MTKRKTQPPAYRPPSGQWRQTLNYNKEVTAALNEFFMLKDGRMVSTLRSLSKFYQSLEKQDRPADETDFFLALCKPALDAYDDLYQTCINGEHPMIDHYLYVYGLLSGAEREVAAWMQVKSIFAESRGLTNASFIEVITKARRDLEAMNKGRHKDKEDALSKELTKILTQHYNLTGEFPKWRDVIDKFKEGDVIQEVDYESEVIFWRRTNGKEDKTSFDRIPDRLSGIRKKIIKK